MNTGERQKGEPITYARIQATLDSMNERLSTEDRRRPIYPMEEIQRLYAGRHVGLLQRTIAPGRSIDSARVIVDAATPEVLKHRAKEWEDKNKDRRLRLTKDYMGDIVMDEDVVIVIGPIVVEEIKN